MKILHTYCLNYNLGDYFLGIGLKNLLRRYLNIDLIANTNLQGREFNEYYITEVVNKKYDLLVIGGGGIIHGAHWPNGWFWLIEKDKIKKINIPFIVYGVGVNYWEDEGSIPNRTIDHLNETIKYSKHFSVRNDGSRQRLLNQTDIDVEEVPDPGFHVNLDTNYTNPINNPYIIIQLAYDKPKHRFGDFKRINTFINHMRTITKQLSKTYTVIFSPHVFDDIALSKKIAEGINNTIIWDFGYFAFDHTREALSYYKHAEFVIAMRGHGQITPFAFNSPVITIVNHPKHLGLMNKFKLLNYTLNLRDHNFLSKLKQIIKKLKREKNSLVEKYITINKKLLKNADNTFKQIKNSIL